MAGRRDSHIFFCNNIHTRHKTAIDIWHIVSSDSGWLLLLVNKEAEREKQSLNI